MSQQVVPSCILSACCGPINHCSMGFHKPGLIIDQFDGMGHCKQYSMVNPVMGCLVFHGHGIWIIVI